MGFFKLNSCCYFFSLTTGSWLIGWWTAVSCAFVIFSNIIFYLFVNIEDEAERFYSDHMILITILVKLLQMFLSLLLLIGAHQGLKNLILSWIVVNSALTIVSIMVYLMMMTSAYYRTEAIFLALSGLDVYLTWVVISYYSEGNIVALE